MAHAHGTQRSHGLGVVRGSHFPSIALQNCPWQEDNPAEELNRFPEARAGGHWGYPYCFTAYQHSPAPPGPRGTVWAWPSFVNDGVHDDAWCRANTNPPELSMQAHSAPLGLAFYASAFADAAAEVRDAAAWVTSINGGHGAVREVVEHLLKAQGCWDRLLSRWQNARLKG